MEMERQVFLVFSRQALVLHLVRLLPSILLVDNLFIASDFGSNALSPTMIQQSHVHC
jgi:hypothetical protein